MGDLVALNEAFPLRAWCFVRVMMIQKNADKAERLGVGVVHELAWVSAAPEAALMHLRWLDARPPNQGLHVASLFRCTLNVIGVMSATRIDISETDINIHPNLVHLTARLALPFYVHPTVFVP
jgi:hypothetical protein